MPAPPPDARDAYLAAMRLVPGAVAVVASAADGERSGMTATAWTSLSADPPTLLACVNKRAGVFPIIRRAGAFSVNLLTSADPEAAAVFSARRGLHGDDRFRVEDWETGALGQPLMTAAAAAFECRLEAAYEHASHAVFIGRVEGAPRRRPAETALIYVDGGFGRAVPL